GIRDFHVTGVQTCALPIFALRKIAIQSGYRKEFWYKNCVAVGLSAGFLEPLEASALVMIEYSAKMISEQMPVNREQISVVAKRRSEERRVGKECGSRGSPE